MSKIITVKVGGAVGVPTVTADNVANATAWQKAHEADVASGAHKGEVNFRAYGLFAISVIFGSKVADIRLATGATEGVDKQGKACLVGGADKGQISKAGKVLRSYVSAETPTVEDYAEALELAIADYGALYPAYNAINGKDDEPKPERSWQSKFEAVVKQALAEGATEQEIAHLLAEVFAEA